MLKTKILIKNILDFDFDFESQMREFYVSLVADETIVVSTGISLALDFFLFHHIRSI